MVLFRERNISFSFLLEVLCVHLLEGTLAVSQNTFSPVRRCALHDLLELTEEAVNPAAMLSRQLGIRELMSLSKEDIHQRRRIAIRLETLPYVLQKLSGRRVAFRPPFVG